MKRNATRLTRALSIRQPHADRIMTGMKRIEYRSIPTSIRGRVYVYASRKPAPPRFWRRSGYVPGDLPTGVLIGTVEIVGCKFEGGEYSWFLARPKRLAHLRKPKGIPQPVWFRPF
jgi:hypothetical protein